MSNLKVAVRVRPMSQKEIEIHSVPSVAVDDGIVSVTNIKVPEHHAGDSRERVRKFAYDYCFNETSTQDEIFLMIEAEVANALSHRYHACVLAYGQSSTGKTYTMMGLQNEPGLTPRLCERVFKYFQSSVTEDEVKEMRTSVSYLEIYNERVQDLLSPINHGKSLKVREHPKKGPYVENLSEHQVNNSEELLSYLSIGNGNRRVAATSNNRRSSRSHSVFTITSSSSKNCCSRLHLVDLAGSERAHAISANLVHQDQKHSRCVSNRPRLKEGANINRSLVALGNVICALADESGKSSKSSRKRFVPYRDSILTWLLKETLSGNSKTVMIATISPASSSYSETVNTLRFGQRAKQIVNRPIVNEDAKEILIRELRAEILRLKQLLNLQEKIELPSQDSNSDLEMTEPSLENIPIEKENIPAPPAPPELVDLETTIPQVELQIATNNETKPEEEILENVVDDNKTSNGDKNPVEEDTNYTKTDKLIPVIDITSTVKPKYLKAVPLNRTLSVDFPKSVLGKFKRDFGSHETLSPIATIKARRSSIRESSENIPLKIEATETPSRSGSISESSGKSTPKRNLTQTRRVHRRSDVVAAVTQRLYSKTVKKDDKQMEDTKSIFPRQNLCSTTRMKLQEFTHRALRASKRKTHSETQTDNVPSTLRVKEKSTDVQDMNIATLKVKDANVSAVTDVQSIGVNCRVENYSTTIKLTRSCSSQTEDPPKNQISFTNYLKNPPLTVHTYTQPIYTSSVNINVSHNFKEEISDDSLEDNQQNIQLSTPDLISNHNSLEQTTKIDKKTLLTHGNKYPSERFYSNEYFATRTEFCVADSSVVAPQTVNEMIQEVTVPVVCLPEIRNINEFNETCTIFKTNNYSSVKSIQTIEPILKYTIEDKPNVNTNENHSSISSRDESDTDSSISVTCDKKVRFSPQLKRRDMMDALQTFMGEASSLLLKLNSVVRQVERSEEMRNKRTIIVHQKLQNTLSYDDDTTKECYVQTYFPYHDASSQTSRTVDLGSSSLLEVSDTEIDDNKWEHIVKESCDKLEQCVKLAEHKSREEERKRYHSNRNNEQLFDSLHKFPQPFSSDTDWKYLPNDYSSLETTHSASDYGSLPRRDVGFFRKSPYKTYSPKAYMQQLVAMRKQIVQSSRHDLMDELKLPLSTE